MRERQRIPIQSTGHSQTRSCSQCRSNLHRSPTGAFFKSLRISEPSPKTILGCFLFFLQWYIFAAMWKRLSSRLLGLGRTWTGVDHRWLDAVVVLESAKASTICCSAGATGVSFRLMFLAADGKDWRAQRLNRKQDRLLRRVPANSRLGPSGSANSIWEVLWPSSSPGHTYPTARPAHGSRFASDQADFSCQL